MKAGGASSLNPYAPSYVPLFKRGNVPHVDYDFAPGQELNRGNEDFVWDNSSLPRDSEVSEWNDNTHGGDEFFASTSQYSSDAASQISFDGDIDMDVDYLQKAFPGISEEFLSDVYLTNFRDLEAAANMLKEMEIRPDKLPDTLDIGDVPSVSIGGRSNHFVLSSAILDYSI